MTEVALLARAMTYKFAALGQRVGGAKAGVRGDATDRAGKATLMTRFCAEVRPMVAAGRFLTGPDMGTSEEDFAPLREGRAVPGAMGAVVDGVPFEDVVTGYGVTVAAGAALDAGGTAGGAGAGTAARRPSRGSARWAAAWPARSSAAAGGWSRCPPWPGASRTPRAWISGGCSGCAASTATRASCATAARSCRRACFSPR